ncbi:MAG TPA: nucleoside deaminase [Rhodanobacteraceae bacterium]|nr:nucleoside deaminase [Rhodanobacteraceae bacterium]
MDDPMPTLPAWIAGVVDFNRIFADMDAQIAFAIQLARLNVEHASGGPFGAAIFDGAGTLVAVGVNRVECLQSSLAHAEIIALVAAQRKLGRARLGSVDHSYTLAASAQPCCQCYGAIVWAGIQVLLIAARAADTETLAGFDEGPLPADWVGEFERRGIRVIRDLHREDARAVLDDYGSRGGVRY